MLISDEVRRIGTFNDQQVNKKVRKVEELQTLSREDKARMNPIGDVLHRVDLSATVYMPN